MIQPSVTDWMRVCRNGWRAGINVLFPLQCHGCACALPAESEVAICHDCQTRLLKDAGPTCPKCGELLPPSQLDAERGCFRCKKKGYRFDRVIRLGLYRQEFRSLVLQTKKATHTSLTATLTDWLWQQYQTELAACAIDAVLPVPMHWRRRMVRGTNGPETMAQRLAEHLHVPAELSRLRRVVSTQAQGPLTATARTENVRRAFAFRGQVPKRVLVVDDIMTSGATCHEIAKCCKRSGAEFVAVAVLARAELD